MTFFRVLTVLSLLFHVPVLSAESPRNVGFYYGHESPIGPLFAYDWLVLQPDQATDARLSLLSRGGTAPLAYVAVDEIAKSHALFPQVDPAWIVGRNKAWGSVILDIRKPEVRRFLVDKRVVPALMRGFEGVFLDTLDSHLMVEAGKVDALSFAQAQADLIADIRDKYPEAVMIINRGFHLPVRALDQVDALAFESYFEGFDPESGRYRPVPEEHREWLDARIAEWSARYPEKPVIAIDYTATPQLAEETADRLRDRGLLPVVSNQALDRLGPTSPETIRRQVLVLHDLPPQQADQSQAHSRLGVILEYLGFVPVYRSALEPPLSEPVLDRYHGVVVWWEAGTAHNRLCQWLGNSVRDQLPLVLMGLMPAAPACQRLVSGQRMRVPEGMLQVSALQETVGRFEGSRLPARVPLAMPPAMDTYEPWILIEDKNARSYSPVFIRPEGGVALSPFLFEPGPDNAAYWLFDPVRFMADALKPEIHPGVDATTEAGRRIVTAHIDGDGAVSRANLPGTPQAIKVILDKIIRHYPIPHTVSVIEAEVSERGVYPAESREALETTRQIFREPNVEVASHTFSHPFFWRMMEGGEAPTAEQAAYGYAMEVPGYEPDLKREIPGSVAFVNELTPDDKAVRVFLWSGDARPGKTALRMVRELGLVNVNGGNTRPLKYDSTLAAVWPDARLVGDELQVHAPVLNENVYTDLWTGPFYGYRNARESFDLLDAPYRLKPSGIYYHFYSGTYPESIKALHEVYQHALDKPNSPLYLSEYATRVQARYYSVTTRDDDGVYRWKGVYTPTTVTLPDSLYPDMKNSTGVAGFIRHGQRHYVHLTGPGAALAVSEVAPQGVYLESANARLTRWEREQVSGATSRVTVSANGHVPVEFRFGGAESCRVVSEHPATRLSPVAFRLSGKAVSNVVVECS